MSICLDAQLLGSKEYPKPVATPFEVDSSTPTFALTCAMPILPTFVRNPSCQLEVALAPGVDWRGQYVTDFADIVKQHTALPEASATRAVAAVTSDSAGPSKQLALHGDSTLSLFVRCDDAITLTQHNLCLISRTCNAIVVRRLSGCSKRSTWASRSARAKLRSEY